MHTIRLPRMGFKTRYWLKSQHGSHTGPAQLEFAHCRVQRIGDSRYDAACFSAWRSELSPVLSGFRCSCRVKSRGTTGDPRRLQSVFDHLVCEEVSGCDLRLLSALLRRLV